MPGLHALLSASGAKKWLACPPSARLEERIRERFGESTSEAAEEGTQAHAVAELIRAHIHDEVVISEPIGGRTLEDVAAIMGRSLPWAPGLPLRGDGYYGSFYFKD